MDCLKYTKITKYFVQKHKMESLVKKLQIYRKMLNRHFREKSRKKQEKKAGLSLGNLLDKSCFSIRETV